MGHDTLKDEHLMTDGAEDIVVDPFGGTGTTAVAAERLGRRWLISDLDPRYADAIRERLDAETRQMALSPLTVA